MRVGSREYWQDPASYPQDWELRSVQAARFVEPGVSVLDIGCGPHMALRQHLPRNCVYVPADLFAWTSEVRHIDVDADRFPVGEFGCAMLLGVIEYLRSPDLVFRFAKRHTRSMVVSYCHPRAAANSPERERVGWVNSFTIEALTNLAARESLHILHSEMFRESGTTRQMIHVLTSDRGEVA
jgi:hypothetical protein